MKDKSPQNTRELKKHFRNILPFMGLLGFCLVLLVLDEYFTYFPQTWHLLWMVYYEWRSSRPITAYVTFILSFISLTIYCWAAFRSNRVVRVILSVFFVLAIFVEYGYYNIFRRFMTSVDFWTAALSPWSLWFEAIGMYFNWKALIISTVFILAVVFNWKKPRSKKHPEIILVVFLAGMWFMRLNLPYEPKMGISVFQLIQLLEDLRPGDRIFGDREKIPTISSTPPDNNIVLIIDESLRGDHLGINGYSRDTTPALQKISEKGLITNWGIAVSAATCSIFSNPHILTGVPSTAGLDNRFTSSWPTLFQYAQAMNYKTQYLDAQETYLWNGLLQKDLQNVDVHLTTNDFGRSMYSDQTAAKYIYQQVTQSTGNFIVLNKMGMHIKYENNYPPSANIWLPTPKNRDYNDFKNVVNAYDNALRFNLESFYTNLMPDAVELPNTLIIHTSDHGETLQEHGEIWSHCHNTSPEATVPLFIIGRLPVQPDTSYQASHSNIVPTLLDLMRVPQEYRLHDYAPSLLTARSSMNGPRYFLDGDLQSVEFNNLNKQ